MKDKEDYHDVLHVPVTNKYVQTRSGVYERRLSPFPFRLTAYEIIIS